MSIIDKRNIKLDFGTFKVYRIELIENALKEKSIKVFYKVKEKHAVETSISSRVISSLDLDEYIEIMKDYQIKSLSAIGLITPTPNAIDCKVDRIRS